MKATILKDAIRMSFKKHPTHPMKGEGYTHFSFIVERNKILGMGMNNSDHAIPLHYGYDKRWKGWNDDGFSPAIHSELHAYTRCRGLIVGNFEVVNVRITDGGRIALSMPCECCQEWLKSNLCSTVYFTTGTRWAKMSLT